MIINDLNYFEDASEEVFGGKGFNTTTKVNLVGSASTTDTLLVNKSITVAVNVAPGSNTAELTANTDAKGNTTYAGAIISVQTEPGSSGVFYSGTAYTK